MRRSLTLVAILALSACQAAEQPTETERTALRGLVTAVDGLTRRAHGEPGKMIAALSGADTAGTPDTVVGKTFKAGPNTTCTFLSDDRRSNGADVTASCNGGELASAMSIDLDASHFRAELRMDGLFEGYQASLRSTYDFANTPMVLDGGFTEDIELYSPQAATRHSAITLEGVRLDGEGCAIDGSALVTRDEHGSWGDSTKTLRYAFGPACGDLHRLP